MSTLITLVRELIFRWKAESPKLFVRIQWISGILTALITTTLILNTSFEWGLGLILIANMPLTSILGAIGTFLGGIFTTAKVTVEDKVELTKKLEAKKELVG